MWIFCFFRRNQEVFIDKMSGHLCGGKSRKPVHNSTGFRFGFDIVDDDSLFLGDNPDVIMPECHDIYLGIVSAGFYQFTQLRHMRTQVL